MASSVNVDIVPEDHHCTLCTHILRDPVLTDCCGQLFCQDCLINRLATDAEDMRLLWIKE